MNMTVELPVEELSSENDRKDILDKVRQIAQTDLAAVVDVCDQEGYYTYSGRNDDMIKVSGIYVSPF